MKLWEFHSKNKCGPSCNSETSRKICFATFQGGSRFSRHEVPAKMHIFEGQTSRQKSTQGKPQRLPRLRKAHRDHKEPATDAESIMEDHNFRCLRYLLSTHEVSQKTYFLKRKKRSTKIDPGQASEAPRLQNAHRDHQEPVTDAENIVWRSQFLIFDRVRCRVAMVSHMLRRITGGTFSTSPSPRRHWLTVSRGLEVSSAVGLIIDSILHLMTDFCPGPPSFFNMDVRENKQNE